MYFIVFWLASVSQHWRSFFIYYGRPNGAFTLKQHLQLVNFTFQNSVSFCGIWCHSSPHQNLPPADGKIAPNATKIDQIFLGLGLPVKLRVLGLLDLQKVNQNHTNTKRERQNHTQQQLWLTSGLRHRKKFE